MRLLGSSKSIINKDKDGELVPKIENVECILVHCNLVKNDYQKILNYCIHLFLIKHLEN